MSALDGPSVAYLARCGDSLADVTDAELDAGIDAAETWAVNAEQARKTADARAYRQIAAILWREYRVRAGWRPGNCGTGKRSWHVYRDTHAGPEQHLTANGRTVWFGSFDAARARAAKLNGSPAPARVGC